MPNLFDNLRGHPVWGAFDGGLARANSGQILNLLARTWAGHYPSCS